MRTRLLSFLFLLAAPAVASAQTFPQDDGLGGFEGSSLEGGFEGNYAGQYDDAAPDLDYVWEDGYVLDNGTVVDGFYRERNRPGYRWVEAGYSNGVWVDAHWEPLQIPRGYVVERGGRGHDGYWIADCVRPARRAGFRWVSARWDNGHWRHGYWVPVQARRGHDWVPGYWTFDGQWVDGYWRPARRNDFTWVDGYWAYGRWHPGHWKPTRQRAGYVWSPGYHGRRGYVEGSWRPGNRAGYHWVDGHWGHNGWVAGHWERGNKREHKRRFRILPVNVQTRARAEHRRTWRNGVLQPVRFGGHGNRGERIERRGERIERRGERIERRGERVQDRGERIDRRQDRREDRHERRQDRRDDRRDRRDDRRDDRRQDRRDHRHR